MEKINVKYLILGIITLLICSYSCQPIRRIKKIFIQTNLCYDAKPTNLDELIYTNGYYSFEKEYVNIGGIQDKSEKSFFEINCLFFNDGIFMMYFNPHSMEGRWGRYLVHNDTIKALFIDPPGTIAKSKCEVWFKIIDHNTIQWLFMKYYDKITTEEVQHYQLSKEKWNISPGNFIQLKSLPNPDKSWLKKRRWFWCSESQYKEWRNSSK